MPIDHMRGDLPASLEEQRRFLIEQIQLIQRDFEKAIEPYRKRLVEIEAMRPPGRLILTGENATSFEEILRDADARDEKRRFGESHE